MHEVTHEGYTIKYEREEYPQSPIDDFDLYGTICCAHRRHTLGHVQLPNNLTYAEAIGQEILTLPPERNLMKALNKAAVWLPLYLYNHSGLSISTRSFYGRAHHAEWYSGVVGFIYITLEDIKKESGNHDWKLITAKRRKQVEDRLRTTVEIYDGYLSGNIWNYAIADPNGKDIDESNSYYGDEDNMLEAAMAQIDCIIESRE